MSHALAEAVRDAIDTDGRISSKKLIHVTSKDGTVALHGIVDSLDEFGIAQEAAESVDGVESVENHLKIDGVVDTGPCCPQM